MTATTRTFVAIEIPEARRDDLERLRSHLEPDIPNARWVGRPQLHVTLAFLGDVENHRLDIVREAAAEAAGSVVPFELTLAGLGAFPKPSHPRVLWVGLGGSGVAGLKRLQASLVDRLRAVGVPPADDRFSPHATLARFKTGPGRGPAPDLRPVVQRHQGWFTEPFRVPELLVFSSVLRPGGPIYEARHRLPLHPG
jgi:2'-5' RNA ligase